MKYWLAIAVTISASYGATPVFAQMFDICNGEYHEKCPDQYFYAYCGEAKAVANSVCRQKGSVGARTLIAKGSSSGDKCGYTIIEVTCE